MAAAIVGLLVIVIASYRQTCHAYPNGGGAYTVASANLGRNAGLAAASALLVDYVLTVAVSVEDGVAAITSAFPGLAPHAVPLSVGFVVMLTLVNLRGVKESGRAFATPTYAFLVGIFLMFAVAGYRMLTGEQLQASTASLPIHPEHSYAGLAVLVLGNARVRVRMHGPDWGGRRSATECLPSRSRSREMPRTPWPSWVRCPSRCSSASRHWH